VTIVKDAPQHRAARTAAVLRRVLAGTGLVAVAVAGSATAAWAHGVAATGYESIGDFLWLGFIHMLTGWDHLLFIAGVVLVARRARRTLTLLSLFAFGHSLTLITATLAGWRFDADLVDIVIVDSVAFVGIVGLLRRPGVHRWFGPAVLGFGLIHGLGLATRFQQPSPQADGLVSRLIAFNVGVELAQLVVVYLLYLLGETVVRARRWPQIERAAFGGFVAVGLAGGVMLSMARA
jgi:hydrogenase/urease accessory protein HupE